MKRVVLLAAVLAVVAARARADTPVEQIIALQAVQQQWVQEEMWCGWGEVRIKYQDISLHCDLVEVDLKSMKLHAEGNVVFDQGTTRMACARMDLDLRNKTGTLYDVDAFLPPIYHFRGEEMEKLDPTHYRFHRGIFTSCDLTGKAPAWSINVRDALIEMEGYGHFRGVSFMTRGVPVFYTPRLLWPIKRDRAAGLLVPNIGFDSRRGAYLGNQLFVPLSRSLDTTFFLDTYSKGYLGLGEELRWAPTETGRGEVLGDFVRDPNTKRWEWKLQGKHDQLFAGGYSLKSEFMDLSNVDFFQQFERTWVREAPRALYSHVTLSRAWGPQAFNLHIDHRKTFFSDFLTGATSALVQEKQPELEYRLRSTRVGETPLYISLVGVADQFRVDRAGDLRGRYNRVDLFPTISLLTPGFAWLNITPSFGARATYYSATYAPDQKSFQPESLSRRYLTAGLSIVGPSLSRIWQLDDGVKLKHLIEPRIEYSYVSDPGDQTRIPVFDEKDSVQVSNRMRATFANRLFYKEGKEGSREIASFEISQEYSFSEPLSYSATLQPSVRGPLSLWLRAAPVEGASVDARAYFDAISNKLQSHALSAGLFHGLNTGNLTWYTSYDPTTGAVVSSQANVYAVVGPSHAPWRLETQINYDIHERRFLEQRYVLRWKGSCWAAALEVRDYRRTDFKSRDYRLSVDLTGLGTFLDIRGGLDSIVR